MRKLVDPLDENNNENKSFLDTFDNEPGFYHQGIRAMLAPGHETELIYWFKSMGLIKNNQICSNAANNDNCNKLMEWTPSKVVDIYQWKCKNCSSRKSIRAGSVFFDVKCNFKNIIRILLGWCKGYEVNILAESLGVKRHFVNVLYNIVTNTAKKFLKSSKLNQKLGGPGIIVLVDTYPEGCTNNALSTNSIRPILCIAEARGVPPNYWFEALDRYNRNNKNQIDSVKKNILKIIQEIVLPQSTIVVPLNSTLCSLEDLQELRFLYPTIISIEGLARHDTIHQTIHSNLSTIWKWALEICEEAQLYPLSQVSNFLISQMWLNRFRAEAFEMIVNQLMDMQ